MSKRSREHSTLGDVIKQWIGANRKLQRGLHKVSAEEAWHTVMGNAISKYTTRVHLQSKTLYVDLSSSVLREELSYGKAKIIQLLNEELGDDLVSRIILK